MSSILPKIETLQETPSINKQYAEIAGPLVAGIQKAHSELIASYSDKELETIADFLTRFTENVKAHTEKLAEDSS